MAKLHGQAAKTVISLRNTLVHGAPEWHQTGVNLNHWCETNLRPQFDDNPLVPATSRNPYYPDKCLSYGCAKWCFESILALSDEFFGRIGVASRFDLLGMRADLLARV